LPLSIFSQASDPNVNSASVFETAASTAAADSEAADAGEIPAQGPGTAASRAQEEALFLFEENTPAGNGAAASSSSVFAILKMVLVLALVAGVIYLIVYFLRRMGKPQIEQNPHLKILASTHLGNGRYVHVVSVGKEAWLIGSGEGGVHNIAAISDQEAVDAMALDLSRKKAETPEAFNFLSLVKKFSGGISPKEQDRLEKMRSRREKFKRF
jgi:flagellar biosynthetic protein FliO